MVRLIEDGDDVLIEVHTRPPIIYLDTCALRRVSEDAERRRRISAVFQRQGTLALSLASIVELAKLSGECVSELEDLFAGVGPNWILLTAYFLRVRDQERAGDLRPDRFIALEMMKGLVLDTQANDVSISAMLRLAREEKQAYDQRLVELVAVTRSWIEGQRARYDNEPNLRGRPGRDLDDYQERPMVAVERAMRRLLARESFNVTDKDARDLMHAMVALAACDQVVLDRRWWQFAKSAGLAPRYVGVYPVRDIERFLELLEKVPCGVMERLP